MAPEVMRRHGVYDSRADIYSLGVVAFFALTLLRVYEGEPKDERGFEQIWSQPEEFERRWRRKLPSDVDETLSGLLGKMLKLDKEERISPDEFLVAAGELEYV